eukprot:6415334-Karenia_brevis.AAC.1
MGNYLAPCFLLLPTTPPANIAKRPWPWNTPDRVTKSKTITSGSDIQHVRISDLLLSPRKIQSSASVTGLLLNRSSVSMREEEIKDWQASKESGTDVK